MTEQGWECYRGYLEHTRLTIAIINPTLATMRATDEDRNESEQVLCLPPSWFERQMCLWLARHGRRI